MYFVILLCRLVEAVLCGGWHRARHSAQTVPSVDWNWDLGVAGLRGPQAHPECWPLGSGLSGLLLLWSQKVPESDSERGPQGTGFSPWGREFLSTILF